jgi:triosephosphate isomerase
LNWAKSLTFKPKGTAQMIIAGNWKMNHTRAQVAGFCASVKAAGRPLDGACRMVLFPAFVHLADLASQLSGSSVSWGGQTCHMAEKGAHTGDISAAMLADMGASWVLLGHSERRVEHGETDLAVAASLAAGRQAGLSIMLCVGESQAEREAGQAEQVVRAQLAGSLAGSLGGSSGWQAGQLAIAYEPVWAIGTGLVPQLSDIEAMHSLIADAAQQLTGLADLPVLYGGSVNPANAADILQLASVSGALVGGASLKADDFLAIFDAGLAVCDAKG